MAKTVDNFSTIEEFRKTYNDLAFDVGDVSGLRDALKSGTNDTLVDAVNYLEDKAFFFQEYVYSAPEHNMNGKVSFTGNDSFENDLLFRKDKIQVFLNDKHLVEDTDFIISSPTGTGAHTEILLQGPYAGGTSTGDKLFIYSFTGSFIGTSINTELSSFFNQTPENAIYNSNSAGVILNGSNLGATTLLESGYTLQLAGRTYAEDDITLYKSSNDATLTTQVFTDGTMTIQSGALSGATTITASGEIEGGSLDINGVADISGNATLGADLSVTGTATVGSLSSGDVSGTNATFTGNVDLGNATSDTITMTGRVDSHIVPNNTTRNLGSSTLPWQNVYASDFTGNLTGNVTGDVTGDLTGNVTGTATQAANLNNHDTDDLAEGTNLYYTNARADARIAAASIEDLADVHTLGTPSAGQILAWNASNLRFEVQDNATSSGSITETTNKYLTDDRINDMISAGSGLAKSYNAGNAGDPLDGVTTLAVNTSNGIKLDGDDVELDYEVVSSSSLSGTPSGTGKEIGHIWFVI